MLLEHLHKKFEINRTKIKGGCQSERKVVTHNSKNDLPLVLYLHCYDLKCVFFSNYKLISNKKVVNFVNTNTVNCAHQRQKEEEEEAAIQVFSVAHISFTMFWHTKQDYIA